MTLRRIRGLGKPLLIGVAVSSLYLFFSIQQDTLSYSFFTIFIASFTFILYVSSPRIMTDELTLQYSKGLDIIFFSLIAVSALVGRVEHPGVNDWYYIFIITTVLILAIRIVGSTIKPSLQLSQIILVGLVVRSIPWYSYPIYGQDIFHQTAVGYIISTGRIVPESITYYANFPAAHVFAAASTLISGMSFKAGYFILGIIISLSLVGVYLFAKCILSNIRGVLLATLFVSIGTYHIRAGAEPFAQALFTALVPFVFYLIFCQNSSKRETGVLFILLTFGVTIQNIGPLVLSGVCLAAVASSWLFKHVSSFFESNDLNPNFTVPATAILVVISAGFYYYVIADYLRFQVMRVIRTVRSLTVSTSPTSEPIGTAAASEVPTTELFGYEIPGILSWGLPILIMAGILILATYHVVNEASQKDSNLTKVWYISMAGAIFTLFALAFIGDAPATRALPSVTILFAPVVGWVLYQFIKHRPGIGHMIVVSIVICIVFAGVLAPIVAKAELGDDDFRAGMSSEQVAGANFAIDYTYSTHTSSYVEGYERFLIGSQGSKNDRTVLNGSLKQNNLESIENHRSLGRSGKSILYYTRYRSVFGLEPPWTNKVYSSGSAALYT